jgi:hypothetical protein
MINILSSSTTDQNNPKWLRKHLPNDQVPPIDLANIPIPPSSD